jgi:hypothetical protein
MGITLKITRMALVATLAGLSAGQAHCWLLDDDTDYGCVVEEAHVAQFNGEASIWTNAPKSLKVRIEDCKTSSDLFCQRDDKWGRVLKIQPSITGDPKGSTYWGIMGSFSNPVAGELQLEQEALFASAIGLTTEDTTAVFLLSAKCFELGK